LIIRRPKVKIFTSFPKLKIKNTRERFQQLCCGLVVVVGGRWWWCRGGIGRGVGEIGEEEEARVLHSFIIF